MAATPASTADAEALPNAVADAQRALHGREHPATREDCQSQGCCSAGGIGHQQKGCLQIGTLERRSRQDQAQDRTGAGRPEETSRGTEQQRSTDTRLVWSAQRRTIDRRGRRSGRSRWLRRVTR